MTKEAYRDLLELAAKAAGYTCVAWDAELSRFCWRDNDYESRGWNPLIDDGDAMRLAVKLCISVGVAFGVYWRVSHQAIEPIIFHVGDDRYAATRRAIVRAAAEIGRTM
jgi:hypothetical protein